MKKTADYISIRSFWFQRLLIEWAETRSAGVVMPREVRKILWGRATQHARRAICRQPCAALAD